MFPHTQVSTVRKQVTDGSLPAKIVDAVLFSAGI
jgi:hypothetical protein